MQVQPNRQLSKLKVWQWNARGLKSKRANLQLHIQSMIQPPDIIMIQEPYTPVDLTGYNKFLANEKSRVITYVKKDISALQHIDTESKTEHVIVEIFPVNVKNDKLITLNAYSPPRDHTNDLGKTLTRFNRKYSNQKMLFVGDFNAPNVEWGYPYPSAKGRNLLQVAQNTGFSTLNDFGNPTRIGNSVSRNTSPDITLAKNITDPDWQNTGTHLGSDHKIIEIMIDLTVRSKRRKVTQVDWDAFRESMITHPLTSDINDSMNDWLREVTQRVRDTSEQIETTTEEGIADSKLRSLWREHNVLFERWQSNKLNRALKKQLYNLEKQINSYAAKLSSLHWNQVCNRLNGRLGQKNPWQIFRAIIDPSRTKSASNNRMTQLLHQQSGTVQDVFKEISDNYLHTTSEKDEKCGEYSGQINPELDRDIEKCEIVRALHKLNTTSAPGPDGVTNKILKNLDEDSLGNLARLFNKHWREGTLPEEWKTAKVMLIPKPGKKLDLKNLRPISLTSCLGKLMEHVILNRLHRHEESEKLFPPTMIGFRRHMSTQDLMIRVRDGVIKPRPYTRALLALDMAKAFDRVKHEAILNALNEANFGQRTFNYIQNFLYKRTAVIAVGNEMSTPIQLGDRGTPQGAVLSPFLFNLAMMGLPKRLDIYPKVRHSIYADDITLWCATGSDGLTQYYLQRAANEVAKYAKEIGLECSFQKSELLLKFEPGRKNITADVQIYLDGHQIPQVEEIKVLGLHVHQKPKNTTIINKIVKTVEQTTQLIRRISGTRNGLKEAELRKVAQAFVISRITYAAPYCELTKNETEKIDVAIKKVYKALLGLPQSTSNEKLLNLGLHNTYAELREAQLENQKSRLGQTEQGRGILNELGISCTLGADNVDVPSHIYRLIDFKPMPRNMHPEHHEERRKARAKSLHKMYAEKREVRYVDASPVKDVKAFTVVSTRADLSAVNAITVPVARSNEAEEAAIALAMLDPQARVIITDSKEAINSFLFGKIAASTARLLKNFPHPERSISLIWVPAHAGNPGNETANSLARALTNRSGEESSYSLTKDTLRTYSEILQHYRLGRRAYPLPHPGLNKEQSKTLRRMQTDTLISPYLLNKYYPEMRVASCGSCGHPKADWQHLFWHCQSNPPPSDLIALIRPNMDWTSLLASEEKKIQLMVVERAREVSSGLNRVASLDTGTAP